LGGGLLRELDAPRFSNDGDSDLARVVEFVLDPARDAAGQEIGLFITELIRLDHDSKLASGLHCEAFFDSAEGQANAFEVFEATDVGCHGLGARARARGADRVGGADEDSVDVGVGDFFVV
jgi:hypothetical protein